MDGVQAMYLGRIVSKEHFRVFVHAPDGSQKLVESWGDYEKHMETGLWFPTKQDALASVVVEKPKRIKKQVKELDEEPTTDLDEKTFEVKNDNFLPDEKK